VSVPALLGVSVCEPLVASDPLQLPDAVQLVAWVDDQVMVVELPAWMELEARVSVGAAGAGSTSSATLFEPVLPAESAQLSVKLSLPAVDAAVTDWLPLPGSAPLQPPVAVQLDAFALAQVSVTVPPGAMLASLEESAGVTMAVSAWMKP
jgi:hypothetical protein